MLWICIEYFVFIWRLSPAWWIKNLVIKRESFMPWVNREFGQHYVRIPFDTNISCIQDPHHDYYQL